MRLWLVLFVLVLGCRKWSSRSETGLPQTPYASAAYSFDSLPWGTSDSATVRTLRERGFEAEGHDPAGFDVFVRSGGRGLGTRVLTWFAPGQGLARVTTITPFADSTHSLAAFGRSLVDLVERHGAPVRQTYGLREGRLVAYADWWDEGGNALHLTWRPDVVSADSSSYLIIVDHVGAGWCQIAPKRQTSHPAELRGCPPPPREAAAIMIRRPPRAF